MCHGNELDRPQVAFGYASRNITIAPRDFVVFRLAGLLHDIGHYPFSHAMEHAIRSYCNASIVEGGPPLKPLKHEAVSKRVLDQDANIRALLIDNGIEPTEVSNIFNREAPCRFANLVSSDLDADRIDYLMRSAHHTGLPYGAIDLPYLLSQMGVDRDEQICLTAKALRTAEHLLLGRFFDYQQVVYHKTVVSMEWLLNCVLIYLLKNGRLEGEADQIETKISNGTWERYDDTYVHEKIRELAIEDGSDEIHAKARAIIQRKPPKLIGDVEYIDARGEESKDAFLGRLQALNEKIEVWADHYKIPASYWNVWSAQMSITKVGTFVPASEGCTASSPDRAHNAESFEQAVRIRNGEGGSVSIMEHKSSLMKVLSNQTLYSIRVYVLRPEDRPVDFDEMRQRVKGDFRYMPWK
ncbi:MAG: HD domain-containing protein [Bdellovibrionales bacterium]|jgi:hypothetical protein